MGSWLNGGSAAAAAARVVAARRPRAFNQETNRAGEAREMARSCALPSGPSCFASHLSPSPSLPSPPCIVLTKACHLSRPAPTQRSHGILSHSAREARTPFSNQHHGVTLFAWPLCAVLREAPQHACHWLSPILPLLPPFPPPAPNIVFLSASLLLSVYLRPSGFFSRKLLSHSVVTDFGRSRGRLRARSQKSWARTP